MIEFLILNLGMINLPYAYENNSDTISYANFNEVNVFIEDDHITEIELIYDLTYGNTFYSSAFSIFPEDAPTLGYDTITLRIDALINSQTDGTDIYIELDAFNSTNVEGYTYTDVVQLSTSEFGNDYTTTFDAWVSFELGSTISELYNQYNDGEVNGYREGYEVGYDFGYTNGENEGYNNGLFDGYELGYTEGYQIGLEDNTEEFSIFRFLERITAVIGNILNVQILPNITIGTIIFIPIILKIVEFVVGWFR